MKFRQASESGTGKHRHCRRGQPPGRHGRGTDGHNPVPRPGPAAPNSDLKLLRLRPGPRRRSACQWATAGTGPGRVCRYGHGLSPTRHSCSATRRRCATRRLGVREPAALTRTQTRSCRSAAGPGRGHSDADSESPPPLHSPLADVRRDWHRHSDSHRDHSPLAAPVTRHSPLTGQALDH